MLTAAFATVSAFSRVSRRTIPCHHLYSAVHLEDHVIEENTKDWVRRVVVGWNLCPFAEKPLREGNLDIEIVRGRDEKMILSTVLSASLSRSDNPGTTIVVAPECCPDNFRGYLEFVETLQEDLFPEYDLTGIVQIAPFHPLFEFEDSDGADTYTNKSPHPMFHALREEEVGHAVQFLNGDSSIVWRRNVDLLESLEDCFGGDKLDKIIRDGPSDDKDTTLLKGLLRKHRFRLPGTS